MLTNDELFVGKLVEFLNNDNKLGVIVRVNSKSIKVAFGHGCSNYEPSNFTHTSQSILDLEVLPKDTTECGTFGYIRQDVDIDFTQDNLKSNKLIRALLLNNSTALCRIALFEDVTKPNATKVINIKPSSLKLYFSTRIS